MNTFFSMNRVPPTLELSSSAPRPGMDTSRKYAETSLPRPALSTSISLDTRSGWRNEVISPRAPPIEFPIIAVDSRPRDSMKRTTNRTMVSTA